MSRRVLAWLIGAAWAVVEYIWFPVLFTVAVWVAIRTEMINSSAESQMFVGGLVLAFCIWRLCRLILGQSRARQIYLVGAWCWIFVRLAVIAGELPDGISQKEGTRQAWIMLAPLILGVKHCMASPRKPTAPPRAAPGD